MQPAIIRIDQRVPRGDRRVIHKPVVVLLQQCVNDVSHQVCWPPHPEHAGGRDRGAVNDRRAILAGVTPARF